MAMLKKLIFVIDDWVSVVLRCFGNKGHIHIEYKGLRIKLLRPRADADSVEHGIGFREIGSSVPGQVKAMTYQINTCRFLVRL